MRISLSVWSTRIAAQDFTIWRFQLRRLRQKMVKNGLPDPVENVLVEDLGCSNLFASMPKLLSDAAYGGHTKLILATDRSHS